MFFDTEKMSNENYTNSEAECSTKIVCMGSYEELFRLTLLLYYPAVRVGVHSKAQYRVLVIQLKVGFYKQFLYRPQFFL